jgi:hypothetical protein
MVFLVDPEFGNRNGDNLTFSEDDEYDENAHFNWVNHPIRQFYENQKNIFHQSNERRTSGMDHAGHGIRDPD